MALRTTKFSLIVVETTDVSTENMLALIVRFVNSKTLLVQDRFIGMINLNRVDAESIYTAIKDFFQRLRYL